MDHGMYPGNKRTNEDMPSGPNDNKRNRNVPSARTEYRFLIAESDANAIFGRGQYACRNVLVDSLSPSDARV